MEEKMDFVKKLYSEETGQGATEYMVLMASVVAAILGAAFIFREKFQTGVEKLSTNVETNLSSGFK